MAKKVLSRSVIAAIAGALGVCLVVIAGLGLTDYYRTINTGDPYPSSEVLSDTGSISEKKIIVNDEYSVPSDQPRVIEIPSLNVNGYVQRVSLDRTGAMSTPNNINFAGWYMRSPAPGDVGLSIINGHAGGRYSEGIFRHLGRLVKDDSIRVQIGDLSWRDFKVVSTKVYSIGESAQALFARDSSIDRELHLITCDGVFDDSSQTYDKRLIIVASLL